jgi:hypothetical protein
MWVACPHTTFQMTNCNGSLFIAIKPKAEYGFYATVILFPYVFYITIYLRHFCAMSMNIKTRDSVIIALLQV